ncbi:MAG TPA: helix-turn-helix domain-containing protein, partial [Candidatus Saccharimonadales bacterium]|nr:helix-turn-helix domain-containing protein [Candidatus Saccharimonadales bacterium]
LPSAPEASRHAPAGHTPAVTLRDVEMQAIREALDSCRGNRTRAARLLGIDRSTLRRKMRELSLSP